MAAKTRRPRILIVGCGDVGLRLVNLLKGHARIFALTRSHCGFEDLRAAGAIPIKGDLDVPASLWRIASLAPTVIHLAPPAAVGIQDLRTRHLIAALRNTRRLIYVSTSGVYGDCAGDIVKETRTANPTSPRAVRRLDAETALRLWATRTGCTVGILRVPGIYGAQRLPIERLAAQTPALESDDDVYTNHIHADDLAHAICAALARASPQRIYNASDNSALKMADYFDLVATAYGLAKPPRMKRVQIAAHVADSQMTFMRESRRLDNGRLREELSVQLTYPTVAHWLESDRLR